MFYYLFILLGIGFLFSCKSKIEYLDNLSINTCAQTHFLLKKTAALFFPTFEISRTMYLKDHKSYGVDPGVMLTSLARLHCLSVYFIHRLILKYAVCLSHKWEDLQMNLTLVSSVQVTPSCVTGGAWEWSCLRCWWDSHPSWPQHLQRLRSRSVEKKNTVHFDW